MMLAAITKTSLMKEQKDRHLDAPGEANRDKHINFLAEEMGDVDPADENVANNSNDKKVTDVDNGFFTNDKKNTETKSNTKNHQHTSISSEKIIPVPADEAQVINGGVPEGDNNNLSRQRNKSKVSKTGDDDQAH